MPNDAGLNLKLDNSDSFKSALNSLDRLLTGFDTSLNKSAGALDTFDKSLAKVAKDSASANSNVGALAKTLGTFDQVISRLTPTVAKMADDLARGLAQGGIEKSFGDIANKAGKAFLDELRKVWGIHSPSIVMASFADFLQEGFLSHVKPTEYGNAGEQAGGAFVTGFDKATDKPFQALGERLKARGRELMTTGFQEVIRGGLAGFLQGELISDVGNFDQVLNSIRVFGKLTRQELAGIENDLLKFAEDSKFNPQQVADAFLGLEKAGLSAKDSLATLPPVIDLATTGQIDLARATDLTIRTAQGLGIPFSEATRVVNAFVAGADISTANVEDFGQALQYIAPSSRNLHIPIEQLTTAIALLNDQGIVGERAGTGLRVTLDSLIDPSSEAKKALKALGVTVRDTKGNFVGFPNLLEQFASSVDKLRKRGAGDVQIVELLSKLGDRNTAQAILALTARTKEGTLAFNDYATKLSQANTAQEIAREQMQTFNGVIESFKGSIQSLIIKAFKPLLDDVLAPLIKVLTEVINRIAEMPQPILELVGAVSLAASAFVTLNGALKIANGAMLILSGGALETVGAGLAAVAGILFNPIGVIAGFAGMVATIGLLVPVLVAIGAGIYVAIKAFEDISAQIQNNVGGIGDAFAGFVASIQNLFSTIFGLFEEFGRLVGSIAGTFNNAFGAGLSVDTSGLVSFLKSVSDWVNNIAKGLEQVRQLLALVNAARGSDGGATGATNATLEQRTAIMERLAVLEQRPIETEIERLKLVKEREQVEARLQALQTAPTNNATAQETNKLLREREAIINRIGILTGTGTAGLVKASATQQNYVVKNNDTLFALAKKYGTTVDALKKLNNITDPRALRTGSTIKIPVTLENEKDSLKKQLAEINKNLGDGIDIPIDSSAIAARFREFAKSDLFKSIFGEIDIDQAVEQIEKIDTLIRQLADDLIHLRFDKLIPDNVVIDLSGVKKGIEKAITDLGNLTGLDTSGIKKFIENHFPTEFDFSKVKAAIDAGLASLFDGGASAMPEGFAKQYANQAGYNPGAGIQEGILNSLRNLKFEGVLEIFKTHFSQVLSTIASAAAIVFGGPVGAVIGVAKLIVLAIGEDFLGIGSKLKESGVLDQITKGFEDFKTAVETIIADVFGGKKKKTPGDSILGFDPNAVDAGKVLTPFDQVLKDLAALPKNLGTTFSILGEGIKGFFENLKGVDATGIPRVLEVIAGFFGSIATLVVRGIGTMLPDLGTGLKNFIEAFSNLGKGDVGGAVTSLIKVVGDLLGAVAHFSVPIADAVITFIEKLFGIELPSADEALGGGLELIRIGFVDLQNVVEDVGRSIEDFFATMALGILQFKAQFDPGIVGNADAKAAIDKQIAALETEIRSRDIGKQLSDAVGEQLQAGGGINLGAFLKLNATPEEIAKQLSGSQRANIIAGLKKALEEGDQQAIDVLLPIAMQPQFDKKTTGAAIQTALDDAIKKGDVKSISAILPLAPEFTLDTSKVPAEIKQQITDAADDASNLGTVQTPENSNAIKLPITITPDVKLELDPEKFDANIGSELEKLFKAGKSRDEIIAGIVSYSGLDKETASGVVDKFLEGIQNSIIAKADESGRGVEYRAKIASALAQGIFNFDTLKGEDFNLNTQTLTDAIQGGIGNALDAIDLSKLQGKTFSTETLNAIGVNITKGVGDGITQGTETLKAATDSAVDTGIKTPMETSLDIHSPSGYGIGIGEALTEGIGVGILESIANVEGPINYLISLFDNLATTAEYATARIRTAFFGLVVGVIPSILVATGFTYAFANAWQQVAINAANAETAIKNAIAANGGKSVTVPGIPPKPPGMAGGGRVQAGRVYRVFDTNNPELYTTPDATYLLPAQSGMITPITGNNTVTNNSRYDYQQPVTIQIYAGAGADLDGIEAAAVRGVEKANRANPLERKLINAGAV